jgi:uncharacterized lipoprotein
MANYERYNASQQALEIAKLAVGAGLLKPTTPDNYDNPADSGKKAAEWVGAFIEELTTRIEKL